MRHWWQFSGLWLVSLVVSNAPALAQITPDQTVGTQVTPNVTINGVPSDRVDGGTVRGANLFHSFSDFNVQAGRGAYFTNPAGITNILTRVTGTNPSNINGTLGVLGNANLFLLNPNGIIFGPGARLDLNGSFLATTANSINFADGTQFSASNPQTASLLTISVPVGLGLGNNPGPIQVQGTGHNLTPSIFSPAIGAGASPTGLRVQPGQTLALVGGDVALTGGVLTAPQGRIELGGGAGGVVSLSPTPQGWTLGYGGVQSLRDIQFSQQALVDASGAVGGDIDLVGRQIVFTDRSMALIQNQGWQPGGNIGVNASESLQLQSFSGLNNETVGGGKGGDVIISTPRLTINDGSAIDARTFGAASGGDITINASDFIQLDGFVAASPFIRSALIAINYGSGRGGDITVSTGRLTVLNGASVSALTAGTGASGDVKVNATDAIEVIGVEPSFLLPSNVTSTSFNAGNAGNLTLNTSKLAIRDGGTVGAATGGTGKAGNVTINASESVEVNGTAGYSIPSLVSSSAIILKPAALQLYGLPPGASGASGDITINTGRLSVTNGALINVRNEGSGNGGTVRANARSITLDQQGSITATATSGQGGNIALRTQDLQLRHGSNITATAGGTGNGGNVAIDTDTLVALEDSNITANAVRGRGGNIQIATQGIFLSPDSHITASSQLGVSGVVNVSVLNFNQQNAIAIAPSNFLSAEQVVADSCLTHNNARQGKFVVTGNGGLPETPDEALVLPYELAQVRAVGSRESAVGSRESAVGSWQSAVGSRQSSATVQFSPWKLGDPIVEATEFAVTKDGQVALRASASKAIADPGALTCQVN